MWFFWRRWLDARSSLMQNARARRWVRHYRPHLERLEDRTLPSVNVLGYHNDNLDTGQNLNETVLTPASITSGNFGELFATQVNGEVYAEPLTVAGVNITSGTSQGVRNVVFVATENDNLYAIDADNGVILWQLALLTPEHGGTVTPIPSQDVQPVRQYHSVDRHHQHAGD